MSLTGDHWSGLYNIALHLVETEREKIVKYLNETDDPKGISIETIRGGSYPFANSSIANNTPESLMRLDRERVADYLKSYDTEVIWEDVLENIRIGNFPYAVGSRP